MDIPSRTALSLRLLAPPMAPIGLLGGAPLGAPLGAPVAAVASGR